MLVSCCLMVHQGNEEEKNIWKERSLIQTTTYEEEYLGSVELGAFTMPICDGLEIDSLYDEAAKSVVRIEMGQYAGSGLIWRMEEEGMVIVSNKHLLCEASYGTITFMNGDVLTAEIMGYSQTQDLGFLFIAREKLTSQILRDIYEVRILERAGEWIEKQGEDNTNIVQIAFAKQNRYEGTVGGIEFVPAFQSEMLKTVCYSKAGMSGGGVFNEEGYLIGMITGGMVEIDEAVREADITYSILVQVIEEEYQKMEEKTWG